MGLAERLSKIDGKMRSKLTKVLPASVFVGIYSIARSPILRLLKNERPNSEIPSFPIEFGELNFRNDLGNAAGYDKDGKMLPLNYLMGAGFGIVGTVLIKPNKGNYLNSLLRVNPWTPLPASNGAINSLGLPSKGVDYVVKNIDDFRREFEPENFPIGVSIMGHPKQEGEEKLAGTVECLNRILPYADFIKINESCPKVVHDQTTDGLEHRIDRLVKARDLYEGKTQRKVPILVKLRSFGNVANTIRFMSQTGIDGLVGVNTQNDYENLREKISRKDLKIFDYYTKAHGEGVSGGPITDFAYEQIMEAANEIRNQGSPLKLIHVGGIRTNADMNLSREIGDEVILREWYTGKMDAMSSQPFEEVYPNIVKGV